MELGGEINSGMANSVTTATNGDVVINMPTEDATNTQQGTNVPEATTNETSPSPNSRRGRCCLATRRCFESSILSFILGGLIFAGGIALVAASSHLPNGDYFLIGPLCLAAGIILLIKGCVNRVSKRQQRVEQAERDQRITARALTRAQRSQRNEELALSQENLIVPPDYFESVAPPKTTPAAIRQLVSSESQTMFDLPPRIGSSHITRTLQRLSSVQSQTSFPSMVSIGVDTADLPVQLDTISQAPPSYEKAINRPESIPERNEASPSTVTYYIPTEEEEESNASAATGTRSTGT